MGSIRLYSGDDGESHLEEIDPASYIAGTTTQCAKSIAFRSQPPGQFHDWHVAPRRQYTITLSGEAEIGLTDGTVHRLGPGDVLLAEDLTGPGHTVRIISDLPRVIAIVVLDE